MYAPAPNWILISKSNPALPPMFVPNIFVFLISDNTLLRYFSRYLYSYLRYNIPSLALIAYAAITIPSNTRYGRSVRITLSLKVPGSPSSALQNKYLTGSFALRQNSHLSPVGKPAPPRPRISEALISSITVSGVISAIFLIASPGLHSSPRIAPTLLMLLLTIDLTRTEPFWPSPYASVYILWGVLPALIELINSLTRKGVSCVKTTLLINAAGSWSFIPISEVSNKPISPSSVTSPNLHPASSSNALATVSLSFIIATALLFRYTVYLPLGFLEKKW